MIKKRKLLFQSIIYILVLILTVYYLHKNYNDFKKIFNLPLICLFFNSLFIVLSFLLEAKKLQIVLNQYNVLIPFYRINLLIYIRGIGNLIFYKLGTAYNIMYFKKKYHWNYTKSFSSFLFLQLFNLLMMIFFIACGFLFLKHYWLSFITLIIIVFVVIIFHYLSTMVIQPTNKIKKILIDVLKVFKNLKKNSNIIFSFIIIDLFIFIFQIIRLYIINYYINYNLSIANIFFISISFFIIKTISITPAGLGVKEGLSGIITKMFQHSYKMGILLSFFERILNLLIISVLGIISFIIINFFNNHLQKRQQRKYI